MSRLFSIVVAPGQTVDLTDVRCAVRITHVTFRSDAPSGHERCVVKLSCNTADLDWDAPSTSEAAPTDIVIAALIPQQLEHATVSVDLPASDVDCYSVSTTGSNTVQVTGVLIYDDDDDDDDVLADDDTDDEDGDMMSEAAQDLAEMRAMARREKYDWAMKIVKDAENGGYAPENGEVILEPDERKNNDRNFWNVDLEDEDDSDGDFEPGSMDVDTDLSDDPEEDVSVDMEEVKAERDHLHAHRKFFELREARQVVAAVHSGLGI